MKGSTFNCKCAALNCDQPATAKWYCNKHYKRVLKYGSPEITPYERNNGPKRLCKVQDCTAHARSKGYCMTHWARVKSYDREHIVTRAYGTGTIRADGYKRYSINGALKFEHIMVAEAALGKPLPPGAVVHHMNEDKLDNFTPFNLVICPDRAYHNLLHERMREYKRRNNKTEKTAEDLEL